MASAPRINNCRSFTGFCSVHLGARRSVAGCYTQRGMSLIEVMVALVVLGLTSAALMGLFLAGGRSTAVARHDVAAVNVAQEILEQVKAVPENQLGTAQEPPEPQDRATTIRFEDGTSDADDYYNDLTVALTGGTGAGQVRKITDYNGTTRTATVDRAWDTVPDTTTTYAIFKGTDAGYAYRVAVTPGADPLLLQVTVTVTYRVGDRQREVSLTTERPGR